FVGVGVVVRKCGVLSEEADSSILKLVINLLMPCLIFSSIVGNESVKDPANSLMAPLAGFLGAAGPMLLCLLLSKYVFRFKGLSESAQRSTFAVATGLQNYGYIAIPVIAKVFGNDLLGVLMLHNMGVELALWSVGVMIYSGKVTKKSWRKLLNGPSFAVVISMLLNTLSWDVFVPIPVINTVTQLGQCAIPIGLLLIGATVYDYSGRPEFSLQSWKESISVIGLANVLRSGVLPLVLILFASVMPYTDELKKVLIVEAAMPAAFFPIVMARHYGGRPGLALQIAMSSMLIGMLALALWISFGRAFLSI
ncbi:MAG: AEC family transporter, partial [Lentisphaeraceae bacterium]|nr:AEC family transporter [Lentisphaeraceae bacterium]